MQSTLLLVTLLAAFISAAPTPGNAAVNPNAVIGTKCLNKATSVPSPPFTACTKNILVNSSTMTSTSPSSPSAAVSPAPFSNARAHQRRARAHPVPPPSPSKPSPPARLST